MFTTFLYTSLTCLGFGQQKKRSNRQLQSQDRVLAGDEVSQRAARIATFFGVATASV